MGVLRNSWISDRVEVRVSARHGRGVFATEPVASGEKVAVFGGEILDMDEYLRLPPELRIYIMQIDDRLLIGCRSSAHLIRIGKHHERGRG